jgi:hypothetical protein
MKTDERAWQAGIIDGEGCITISKQMREGRPSPAYRPMITVTNTDRRLIQPFSDAWGGALYHRPDSRKNLMWADSWTWYCPRTAVVPFLKSILPYLRGKHEQAKLLIDFTSRCKTFPRSKGTLIAGKRGGSRPLGIEELEYRDTIWNQVRELNTKGQFSRRAK